MKMRIKQLDIAKRKKKKRAANSTTEIEIKTSKCIIFLQNENTSRKIPVGNECEIIIGQMKFVLWTVPPCHQNNKIYLNLKQYLAFHKCEIIFFMMNLTDYESQLMEIFTMIRMCIIE